MSLPKEFDGVTVRPLLDGLVQGSPLGHFQAWQTCDCRRLRSTTPRGTRRETPNRRIERHEGLGAASCM